MAMFFRKLRKKLLSEERTSKYLKYAIGEIVLVVIGILIALQINNWNQYRKEKDYEIAILAEIRENLIESNREVRLAIRDDKRWRSCSLKILHYLDTRKAYDTSLDQCLGSYYWSSTVQFSTSAYEELKSKGLELISNVKLRRQLTNMYDAKFDVVESEVEIWDNQLLVSTIYPLHTTLFRKYFPESWSVFKDEYATPVDYEKLMDNDTFKNVLNEIISLRNYSITINEMLAQDLDNLIAEIETELTELKE